MTYVLSDIHGSLPRFESIMAQINLQAEDMLISRISEERIGKRDKGGIPPMGGCLRFTPPGNAGRGFYTVFEVLPFGEVSRN